MADVTIDQAGLLEEITGLEKIPVGNGSGNPATVTINQILNKVDNKINEEVYTKEEINAMLSTSLYEWVDLGLPSGLKWAAWNVGATKPEEYGLYFAWGETQGYTGITDNKKFSWSDYKWCNGSNTTLTKYNNNSSYGTVDNLSSLTASDDAASAAQSTCRIPTKAEFEELAANTTSAWTNNYNGRDVKGMIFTSKVEGYTDKSIFVPASGGCSDGSLGNTSSNGYCWSSSLLEGISRVSWSLYFNSASMGVGGYDRCYGRSVRAVQDANVTDIFDPTDYPTKEEVNNKISELETQTESFVTTNDLSGYATKEELSNTTETTPIINHGTNDSVYALTPNVYHIWEEMTSLELTLSEPTNSNIYNEYMFEFISGETATTLSLPSTIKWVSTPNIESNKIYQCSIVNNVGVIAAASNS